MSIHTPDSGLLPADRTRSSSIWAYLGLVLAVAMLAEGLLGAFLPVVLAAAPSQAADLVLRGGHIVTLDAARPTVAAVACREGRILAIGSAEEIQRHISPATKVVDLKNATVVPGFIESHGHFVGLGQSKVILDLTGARRWSEIVEMVRAKAKQTPAGSWIVGRGWHQAKWDAKPEPNVDGYPTHRALSEATPRHPVLLIHASGHMSLANDRALQIAGVNADTVAPSGGEILHDKNGEPTGVLRERAQGLVRYHRDSPAAQARELERAVELATRECLQHGVTSFQDAGSSLATVNRLRQLERDGRLGVRLWVMLRDSNARLRRALPKLREEDNGETRAKGKGAGDGFLTVRAIKRSLDGALGPHGAWLLEPYTDMPESRGLQTISLESLRETAEIAARNDFQLCVHAIGDRANRETLDVFQAAFQEHPSSQSRRWRVEHAQHLHPDDIPRFKQLGVIASMQSVHCTSDAVFVVDRLGEKRAKDGAYVWQSLLESGAVLCNGTDTPVERVDPLACFRAAVTRRSADGSTFFPQQCMTREQALRSYTLDAAYAAFEEDQKGSITPGKLADMVVLSHDILKCSEQNLRRTRVLHTIVAGKLVYSRP